MFWVPLAVRPAAEQNKTNKRFSTRPSSGRGRGALTISRRAVSSISGSPVSGPLAPALSARFGGLDGLGVLPATGSTKLPGGMLLHGSGCPRRRVGWGATAGVEAAGFLRCMMYLIASVCFCAAENCWAKLSTASLKRPICDTGAFRNCTFSCTFMSGRHSHRWCFWTTSVDIARPRDCAITFVARSTRFVAACRSRLTARSWPPSCRSFRALAFFSPIRPWPPLLRRNARTSRTLFCGKESSRFNHYRSAPKRKDELMRCTCCLLYSRCDQR